MRCWRTAEYLAENIFWVPSEARWGRLQANAKQPEIERLIDDAMVAIERENSSLKGVLPKDYSRPSDAYPPWRLKKETSSE